MWIPIKGAWVDSFVSGYFSRRLDISLGFHGVRIRHWDSIDFEALEASRDSASPRWTSGAGTIHFKHFPFLSPDGEEAVVRVEQLTLPAGSYKNIPLSFFGRKDLLARSLTVEHIKLSLSNRTEGFSCHLLRCDSKSIHARGGFKTGRSGIVRVHALLLFPAVTFEKLPAEFRSRFIQRTGGWQGLRILYSRHILTAVGAKGPFFRAQWQ